MNVCHLIASDRAGGPEKQILQLSLRLREAGWPVTVGSFLENRPSVELLEQCRAHDLPTFVIDTRSPFSPDAIRQAREGLAGCGAELVVTHGYKPNVVAKLATRGGNISQVPIVRGFTAANWKIRAYETLDRVVLKTFPRVLCVSEGTRELMVRHGLRRERLHVLHNAVQVHDDITPLDLRAEFGFPSDTTVLAAAGRLSPEKGHDVLVSALEHLKTTHPEIRLVLLGDGAQRAALERQIEAAGLTGHAVLAGHRQDVLACLAGADLLVNPSHTEGLPNVVLEAMSLGTPVVATDVGGVRELLNGPEVGWTLPAGRPEQMADTIRTALADPERRAQVATAARERARDHFSFEGQCRRFMEFCRNSG